MKLPFRLFLTLLFATIATQASDNAIAKLYKGILSGDAPVPQPESIVEQVNENTLRALSAAKAQELVPLGVQCLQSPSETVRREGLLLLMGITMRSDSTVLLHPHLSSIELIAAKPGDVLRKPALYVLGNTQPDVSPKARAFLAAHLTDKYNSPEERVMIAASLLTNGPGNEATTGKVLKFAENESDTRLKIGVLTQLGALHTSDSHALEFIGAMLDSPNVYVLGAAVQTTGRLSYTVRMQFVDKLMAIEANSQNSPEVRSRASAVLKDTQ